MILSKRKLSLGIFSNRTPMRKAPEAMGQSPIGAGAKPVAAGDTRDFSPVAADKQK